jgi:leader peptidase (prepilin peptidase)/N-methyltransferase
MLFLISAVLFIYGTIIGSFLNVVIYRTPKKEGIVKGRSHCMSCNHTLAWYDLFPVLSWVFLRGKCRYCSAAVSGRYALVESLTGLSYAGAFLSVATRGIDGAIPYITVGFAVVLFPILICLSFYDIDTGEIEYWCPISVAGLGVIALVLSLVGVTDTPWHAHLIGAVLVSVPFLILGLFGAMGGADIQLMAAAGLLLGWKILPAAFLGVLTGTIIGVVYKIKYKPEKCKMVDDDDDSSAMTGTPLRFGPFLAFGIAVAFLYGQELIDRYLSFMG